MSRTSRGQVVTPSDIVAFSKNPKSGTAEGMLYLRKLSVERLARACKVTRTAVYNYIESKNRPTTPVLRRMGEALELPFELVLEYCTPASVGRPPKKQ
jgi:hypothetical protein